MPLGIRFILTKVLHCFCRFQSKQYKKITYSAYSEIIHKDLKTKSFTNNLNWNPQLRVLLFFLGDDILNTIEAEDMSVSVVVS